MEIGYLTVLHVRLGANFGDLHAKDFSAFRKRQILGVGGLVRIDDDNNKNKNKNNADTSLTLSSTSMR